MPWGPNSHPILHKLCRTGYLVEASKEVFRAPHPIVLILERAGYKWRNKIAQKDYLGFLELLVAKVVESFVSLVIFGSVAAGRAKAESDVDLLIMAKELPESYSDRLRLWRGIVAEIEFERLKLWRKKRLYPLIDPILLMPSEAERIQPFYPDLLDNSIIVYDKDEFMQWVLNDLRARLKAFDTIKVKPPSSSWYWIIKPSAGFGKVIRV